jgi:hypothetical protein
MLRTVWFIIAVAASLSLPTTASAAPADGKQDSAIPATQMDAAAPDKPGNKDAKVHTQSKRVAARAARRWKGYGFLPGYRPPLPNNDPSFDPHYLTSRGAYWSGGRGYWWFSRPGFYHGRWNGGGLGPCWKSTPIGMMWICG